MRGAREITLDVEQPSDPLPELHRALRRRYPKAGIVAVGLGMLRHDGRPGRPLAPEPTVKIVVREKLDPLPRGTVALPERLVLRSRWLGRPFRVRIRTDVEQRPRGAVTQFRIPDATGASLCTAAYARWVAGGAERLGVVTAAHGLWQDPSAAQPVASVELDLGAACDGRTLRGTVVCASHLRRDGVDVALVELPGLDPCLFPMWRTSVAVPDLPELLDQLGSGIDDGLSLEATFRHFALSPQGTRAVALYREFPITVAGWGVCRLADVVELEGAPDTFLGGTSGSGLVSKGNGKLALAVQSLCLDGGAPGAGLNRRGLGTSFCRAVSWIRHASGRAVELAWKLAEPE